MNEQRERRAKGVSFGGLVKLLRSHRKKHPFQTALSPSIAELLEQHVLPTAWYPLASLLDLLALTEREILKGNEKLTMQLGVAGGTEALKTYHKAFVRPGDPAASVLAMHRTWNVYFDFGELTATLESKSSVLFVLEGYPDVPSYHGPMIAGWHVAAGIVAGSEGTAAEILECPWKDRSPRLVHRVKF